MKYLLVGDDKQLLFIENEKNSRAIFFSPYFNEWLDGWERLFSAKTGFDSSEPEDSIYRYGSSNLETIKEISKKEAEAFIEKQIDDDEIETLLDK